MATAQLRMKAVSFASGLALALFAGVWGDAASGGDPPSTAAGTPVDYEGKVKPILTQHCVSCHGAQKPRGGLRLDTAAAAISGGKNGPAVVAGKSAESPLIAAVRGEGPTEQMPLNRPALTEVQIKLLEAWIDQGAKAKAGEQPGVAPARSHWAFIPPQRAPIAAISTPGWARNPIDRFIQARLEKASLSPSPEATRPVLLRRLSLDLTGLPPTPAEIAEFLADRSASAFERAVERLLASPHFGERWGRLWLDQARFADSNGYSIDAPRSIWKYRDWVIAALNADMPFDQFAIDQLAGDLRSGDALAPRIATGFHRNTPINQEGGIDIEQFRIESVVDRVNTTGTVFLGLTIGCAQCHDHKFDPISQREYYQLFAFFNNVDEPVLEFATASDKSRRRTIHARINELHIALSKKYPDLDHRERNWEGTLKLEFTQAQDPDVRLAFDSPREKRSASQRRALVELMMAHDSVFRAEHAELVKLRSAEPKIVTTMVVREHSGSPRQTYIHLGGDFTRNGDRALPGVPKVLPPLADTSSGNPPDRMDLARWLVDRRNPLTARVVVNRIWQSYFGRGLVETDNDFGTQGSPPSHPELLDWLACELMDQNWSQKTIHRLIVSSATYRQASRLRPEGQAIDPDNRLLWRQARLRLDAELIRDTALWSSGLLTQLVGGPSVFPPQPDGVMTLGQMNRPWSADRGPNRYRRALYTFFWRATPYPFLTTFDAPGGVQTCTRRFRSNTPLQALTLLNDPAFVEIAERLAARILLEQPEPATDRQRLQHGFLLCLGRPASGRELETLETVLMQERSELVYSPAEAVGREARQSSRAGGGTSLAPWVTVARVLLNLDEFITRE
jgi:mono/diheme cytochrome c family protein